MALFKAGFATLLLSLIVACAPTSPYRTALGKDCSGIPYTQLSAKDNCSNIEEQNRDNNNVSGNKFDLGIVEFSDQGLMYEREQLNNVLKLLKPKDKKEKYLDIVVFVHGWKHSADFKDENLQSFRKQIMPIFESKKENSRTVGIYVAWRGASLAMPSAIQNITVYDRKNAADKVAKGSVRELFAYLNILRNDPTLTAGRNIRLSIIGHSFGGLVVYNSLAESLLNSVITANSADVQTPRLVKPIADLILLLNPAFEASRFEPLFQAAKDKLLSKDKDKPWPYDTRQQPVFISITSEADLATRYAFPIARAVNSIFEHESWIDEDKEAHSEYWNRIEKVANTQTVGHIKRYRTHRLSLNDKKSVVCNSEINKLLANNNDFPLWNMYATEQVISGHNDIYGVTLWSFISKIAEVENSTKNICE